MEHIIIQQQYRFLLCDSLSLIKEDLNIENKVWEKLDVKAHMKQPLEAVKSLHQRLFL